MYPDKTHTRKISLSILKYSTLHLRPILHCSIDSMNRLPHAPPPPLNYRDGLSTEGCRALLFIIDVWIL